MVLFFSEQDRHGLYFSFVVYVKYVSVATWGIFIFLRVVPVYLILTLSTGDPFDADPPQSEHGAVVIDMQEADLVELLT